MEKTLKIEGMMCEHCVKHVHKALLGISGVQDAAVSLDDKSAQVKLSQSVDDEVFKIALKEAGYQLVELK